MTLTATVLPNNINDEIVVEISIGSEQIAHLSVTMLTKMPPLSDRDAKIAIAELVASAVPRLWQTFATLERFELPSDFSSKQPGSDQPSDLQPIEPVDTTPNL